jgi:hypothetical protein
LLILKNLITYGTGIMVPVFCSVVHLKLFVVSEFGSGSVPNYLCFLHASDLKGTVVLNGLQIIPYRTTGTVTF